MVEPIGYFTVGTPGTKVRLTSLMPVPDHPYHVHGVLIQAHPSNTGRIYVGTAGLNVATRAGLLGVIAIPTDHTVPSLTIALTLAPNAINLNTIYLDAEVGGEGAIVAALVA